MHTEYQQLIQQAISYIEENNTLVGIRKIGEWNRQGIIKNIKNANTGFSHDKEIEFIDGTKKIAWI